MPSETLSEQILRENEAVLGEMLRHRFIEDIKADALPRPAFHRYLVYEGAFVDTAIAIFAYAVAKAETIDQKRWLIGVLDALANEQIAYFERTFARLGIVENDHAAGMPEVESFRAGMLDIARTGAFLDIIAAMFAAEWMYWTWCQEAAQKTVRDPLLAEWIDLHANAAFAKQAMWLKLELDTAGERMRDEERARLSGIFEHAMRLEIDFHHAPYS